MDENLIKILTQSGLGAAANASGMTTVDSKEGAPDTGSNAVLNALASRLAEQGKNISSSSSSNLQSEIEKAMADITSAGAKTKEALISEKNREKGYLKKEGLDSITGALEEQTGYGRQVYALGALAETTEKSVRDLDKRYQESILANDAETSKQLSTLRLQKLTFLQQQEESFYSNLISLGNMQEQALSRQSQNEQFWIKKKQDDEQFVLNLAQSSYQFEKNYGLSLQDMELKEKQLEIERSRYNLSLAEYNDKKKELAKERDTTFTKSIISNSLKNSLYDEKGRVRSKAQLLESTNMLKMKEETGFEGSANELAELMTEAYDTMIADKTFLGNYVARTTSYGTGNVTSTSNKKTNESKAQYDALTGVTISSPETFWSSLLK